MIPTEKQDALTRCEVLAAADPEALRELAETANIQSLEPGEVVFQEGEESSNVFVVVSGSLRARLTKDSQLVSVFEPGALFGEYAMFVNGVRTARVAATDPTVLLSIDAAEFRAFLLRSPVVTLQLLQTAVRRLSRAERSR